MFQDPVRLRSIRACASRDLIAEPLVDPRHRRRSDERRRSGVRAAARARRASSPEQTPSAGRTSSRAGSASGSASRARWRSSRASMFCRRKRCRRSMCRCRRSVLKLLKELQREFDVAYLFISHDMAVVENISDRVAVMYLGQIVEMGNRDQIFSRPRHPYTRRLIEAVPVPDPGRRREKFARLDREIPEPDPQGRRPATKAAAQRCRRRPSGGGAFFMTSAGASRTMRTQCRRCDR
jgi:peptide/nickel transport system ATP-binding protein